MIATVDGKSPQVDPSAFLAPGSVVVGEVSLGPQVSVWYGCVLRGDVNYIRIGARTNLQDGTIVHVTYQGHGTDVGQDVVVGHRVVLHACEVRDRALVGMGAVVLDGVVVGEGALVAAGALVPPGMQIPDGMMAAGVPAKVLRPVSQEEIAAQQGMVERYLHLMQSHQKLGVPLPPGEGTGSEGSGIR